MQSMFQFSTVKRDCEVRADGKGTICPLQLLKDDQHITEERQKQTCLQRCLVARARETILQCR